MYASRLQTARPVVARARQHMNRHRRAAQSNLPAIPATSQVVNLLQLEKMDTPVTIGYNLPSKKIGKKGIIKVANKYFTDEEINRLSVVAPNIGLSIIKDYEIVEKKTVETPDTLKGIVKCNNPKCITNNEPMQTLFHTVDKVLGIVRCHYCDKEQQLGKVELCK